MLYAFEITEELKADYVRLIRSGLDPATAAIELDSTGTQFRAHRSPNSQYYDPVFERDVDAALKSDEHDRNELEWLRGLQRQKAAEGHWPAIEKLSYVKDPEWESLRHQNFNVKHSYELIARYVEPEALDKAIERMELEQGEKPQLKALPPASESA